LPGQSETIVLIPYSRLLVLDSHFMIPASYIARLKMETFKTICSAPGELGRCAHELLQFAGDRRIIGFSGELGSGKTTFIKAIAKELDVIDNVSSPTFALINEYKTVGGDNVYHFDFYRVKSEKEAFDTGCEEYFNSDSICLVEWPEKILNLLPKEMVQVNIQVVNEARLMTFHYE